MQIDPWQVRFETLEEFVRMYRRLPRHWTDYVNCTFRGKFGELAVAHQNREADAVGTAPCSQVAKAAVDISCFDSATGREVVGWQLVKPSSNKGVRTCRGTCKSTTNFLRTVPLTRETRKLGTWLRNLRAHIASIKSQGHQFVEGCASFGGTIVPVGQARPLKIK